MSVTHNINKNRVIDQIQECAAQTLSPEMQSVLAPFIAHYYADVADEDIASRDPLDLYGAACSHWQLGRQRAPGQAILRVYNPDFEADGWQSTHTIVEIVNDDMPFLVDSISLALNTRGLTIHLIVHPVVALTRDADHCYASHCEPEDLGCRHESYMHFEIDRQSDPATLKALESALQQVLAEVSAAVEDWPAMVDAARQARASLADTHPAIAQSDLDEIDAFLAWLIDQHYTFLGYRCYDLLDTPDGLVLKVVKGCGLGILRDNDRAHSQSFDSLTPALRQQAQAPYPLILCKSNTRSTVHRAGYLDYVGVKRFDNEGKVIGEYRFLGLYTSELYNNTPRQVPILRAKIDAVLSETRYLPGSHKAKTLLNVLETYPRDELLELSIEQLRLFSHGIVNLQERQRVRLFVRRDPYGRYYACLLYVPRDNWNTEVRLKIQALLLETFQGRHVEFWATLSESMLARIEFIVRVSPEATISFSNEALEQQVAQLCRRWEDSLGSALIEAVGEEHGTHLLKQFHAAFPAAYREDFQPRHAVQDILKLVSLTPQHNCELALRQVLVGQQPLICLKLFRNTETSLSRTLPMLENMGGQVLEERPYMVRPALGGPYWVTDFSMQLADPELFVIEQNRDNFLTCFSKVFNGEAEDDGLNRLILLAGLDWREVAVLRAYNKYLRQAGLTFSQHYVEQCLASHAHIVWQLIALFKARHDPIHSDSSAAQTLFEDLHLQLDRVANLADDRILRGFLTVILATLRTNYFQRDSQGHPKPYISFKLNSGAIDFLPLPKPLVEIWVYSPRMEGIHLRGGKVARGGLRWSDRMEDVRTEVLGLVKAQMVKNAVIVPVGSKGGFVCKKLHGSLDRDAIQAEGVACYQTFIRGLLDLTDNRVGGKVIPPADLVRLDTDDPYLVVAADKGTATFSDVANTIALEYGFWLGDAFASGGSAGYDHKQMGITARGTWESVKRHFREIGLDIQTNEFTVVGIGDMSGDVFGNGMLLSPHIRLLAAFDHRHIFIDPNPDPAISFAERQRLFKLPRSSWADYTPGLISAGGGVYPRSLKSIKLSAETRAALAITHDALTPNDLIKELLKAPVDLLYNGGIGTYVKGSRQSHAEANDRANDLVRVDGRELRCRVVAEGGNLGLTQPGRIEYALGGGRINTDAIDNSAGVDCSDHEVNIKVLLNAVMAEGELSLKHRNQLLADMTDDVAALVLADNYLQTEVLSLSQAIGPQMLNTHARFITYLERVGRMSRRLEYLPNDEEIAERRLARQGLTRPELAVLLAYAKIDLYDQLLESSVPDETDFNQLLLRYFPNALGERYTDQMLDHTLKREIVATFLTNNLINRMGMTFIFRVNEETGFSPADITRAWYAASQVFNAHRYAKQVESLDGKVAATVQYELLHELRKLIERATRWMLRNCRFAHDCNEIVQQYQSGVSVLIDVLPGILQGEDKGKSDTMERRWLEQGVPAEIASALARAEPLLSSLDILDIAHANMAAPEMVAQIHFDIGANLSLDWMLSAINRLPRDNRWSTLARSALRDDLYRQHRSLTALVLQTAHTGEWQTASATWRTHRKQGVDACRELLTELQAHPTQDLAMLSAALRELRNHLIGT
ncbi:glutamate dehydrogenase [Chitinivorax tropicus]|uniref:Glutamate dehydrogenase n=1 Tax=Chitinivorax tropicus TaxID=714531 RepID=A0A840MSQ3_9PROT|nr:NAD-glutamate dehydrogenase [Chitinivorax tropicus]MBB5020207.1 glutamate dehydrogenase [Chitinivorax tropicus]